MLGVSHGGIASPTDRKTGSDHPPEDPGPGTTRTSSREPGALVTSVMFVLSLGSPDPIPPIPPRRITCLSKAITGGTGDTRFRLRPIATKDRAHPPDRPEPPASVLEDTSFVIRKFVIRNSNPSPTAAISCREMLRHLLTLGLTIALLPGCAAIVA